MRGHRRTCDQTKVDALLASTLALAAKETEETEETEETFACPHDGCDYMPSVSHKSDRGRALRRHIKLKHSGFEPKPCEDSCALDHLYSDPVRYKKHRQKYHDPATATALALVPCTYPGCTHPIQFSSIPKLKIHLNDVYGLTTAVSYLPYLPAHSPRRKWVAWQGCFLGGCQATRFELKRS